MQKADTLTSQLYKARIGQSAIHGFLPQELIAFGLPNRRTDAVTWSRRNGDYAFSVTAGTILEPTGELVTELPSGKYARAALVYLCTRAKLTSESVVNVSESYRAFTTDLGLDWQGAGRAKEAVRQLMLVSAATFSTIHQYKDENGELHYLDSRSTFAEGIDLWTNTSRDVLSPTKSSTVTLSPTFMKMLDTAVPISMKSWRWLLMNSKSAMALDIYTWLCYRLPRCTKRSRITWAQLHEQFGSTAPMKRFKQLFRDGLETALKVYPEAQIKESHGSNKIKGFKGFYIASSPDPRDSKTPTERAELEAEVEAA